MLKLYIKENRIPENFKDKTFDSKMMRKAKYFFGKSQLI